MSDSSHGHTPAAWTGVIIALIGFSMGSVFMVMAEPLGVIAGLAVVALGGVAGLVMRSMGLGQAKETPARVASRRSTVAAAES